MKVHASDSETGEYLNGSGPAEPDEPQDDWAGEDGEHDFSHLFTAPNYSDFIKTKPNSQAQTYEKRFASLMKAGMIVSLNNQQYPDAAAFLKHGPGLSKAAGNLAAEDPRVAKMIDMITAPDSPYVMFMVAGISLAAQLFRNHQSDIAEAGSTWRERRAAKKREKKDPTTQAKRSPITVHVFKRRITIPIRFRLKMPNLKNVFKGFLAPTQHPMQITEEVFGDKRVQNELRKMGIYIGGPSGQSQDAA